VPLIDRDQFLAGLCKAIETTEDPRGPMKVDEYSNPTQNVYILKVERVGGKLQNTVVQAYPMVSQFWTYPSQEFLKHPLYCREYRRPSRNGEG
jgi:branched-chain amino acid transport system substrate-binding protein